VSVHGGRVLELDELVVLLLVVELELELPVPVPVPEPVVPVFVLLVVLGPPAPSPSSSLNPEEVSSPSEQASGAIAQLAQAAHSTGR